MQFSDQDPQEEPPKEVDEFTGQPDDNSKSFALKRDLKSVIDQAEALKVMKETAGWRLLERFIDNQVRWMTEALKVAKDIDSVRRIQSEILAFESLPKIIEKSFFDAEEAKARLLEMTSSMPN